MKDKTKELLKNILNSQIKVLEAQIRVLKKQVEMI